MPRSRARGRSSNASGPESGDAARVSRGASWGWSSYSEQGSGASPGPEPQDIEHKHKADDTPSQAKVYPCTKFVEGAFAVS